MKSFLGDTVYTPLDREWFYYDFAVGRFYIMKLCSIVYSI